jgi:uncharacterized protein
MRFNPKARLDSGRIRDAGGGGGGGLGGGGMQIPIPGGVRGGGGIGMLLIVVLFLVLSQCLGGGLSIPGGTGGANADSSPIDTSRAGEDSDRYANCQTGEDANNDEDCLRMAVENSLTDFWEGVWPDQVRGVEFRPESSMVTFSGGVQTACGAASSQMGPFYCPSDESIYLDTTFFEAVLQQQLGGPAGSFVEPYVLAHEYGHHIQKVLGTMNRVRTQQGPKSDAVRLELQADCYAGMWTAAATRTQDDGGEPLITELSQEDIDTAIAAAAAVGDDRIQERVNGRVNPESWTHGSAEQRQRWFGIGFEQGSMKACDTFATDNL